MELKKLGFQVIANSVSLLTSINLAAGATITFEDLPNANFFSAGGQNIGSLYSGLTFGPDVTGLSVSRFGGYTSSAFPPHSGDVVIWSATSPNINVAFTTPESQVGAWYTSFDPLTLTAFNAMGQQLGKVTGTPNTDGTTGRSDFLSISGTGIAAVTFSSTPSLFTLDDLTFQVGGPVPPPATVPEPGSFSMLLIAIGLCGVTNCRRTFIRFSRARHTYGNVRGSSPWRLAHANHILACLVSINPA